MSSKPHSGRARPSAKEVASATPQGKVSPKPPLPPPSADERKAIDQAITEVTNRLPRFEVEFTQKPDGGLEIFGGAHNDHGGWLTRLENVFGTRGSSFAYAQLSQLLSLCQDSSKKIDGVALNGLLSIVESARPWNELEAALAVQMAMTHMLTTQAVRRAAKVEQIPQYDSAAGMAVKLARTFTMQAEALAKMQRGGEQVVKVVHVHAGAKAVIGNVNTGANGALGEGVHRERDHQPHAPSQLSAPRVPPMPQVRSEDEEREPVPLAGGGG